MRATRGGVSRDIYEFAAKRVILRIMWISQRVSRNVTVTNSAASYVFGALLMFGLVVIGVLTVLSKLWTPLLWALGVLALIGFVAYLIADGKKYERHRYHHALDCPSCSLCDEQRPARLAAIHAEQRKQAEIEEMRYWSRYN